MQMFLWSYYLDNKPTPNKGCYSANKFKLKLPQTLIFCWGNGVTCFFSCKWSGVGKKDEKKGKGVMGKFSFRIVCQNHIPFSLNSYKISLSNKKVNR